MLTNPPHTLLKRFLSAFRRKDPKINDKHIDPPLPPPPPYVADGTALLLNEKEDSQRRVSRPKHAPSNSKPVKKTAKEIQDAKNSLLQVKDSLEKIKALGPTSSTHWAKTNPSAHIDRMRRFLYRYLMLEYTNTSSSTLPIADNAHFLSLSRLIYHLIPYQNLHGWNPKDEKLRNEIWEYIQIHLRQPLIAMNINESHIVQLLHFFFHSEALRETLDPSAKFHTHKKLAEKGWFELLRSTTAGDLELVEVVAPKGGANARQKLAAAVKGTQKMYFVVVDEGNGASKPNYELTNFAKMNLCPCCKGKNLEHADLWPEKGSWEEFEMRIGVM
jgi:hypothetical protein